MKQYDSFIFDSYNFDPATGRIELRYSLDDELKFTETLQLPLSQSPSPDPQVLNAALFALHLIGGISYYKTCLPKTIDIRSGQLTKDQAKFWNTVYEQGLGEFFFKNQIDFRGLINFQSSATSIVPTNEKRVNESTSKHALVPIGGGKDSVVAAEILRTAGVDSTLFRMGSHPLITELAKKMNLPLLEVDRRLDPLLFKLNTEGALNGHVPITAYLSFVTIIVAILQGFDWIVMSNERSANEGNTEFMGKEINHQWSKSAQFEEMMRWYVANFITGDITYFSVLRPLSELHIVKTFMRYPQYFPCTTSCNNNWKIQKSDQRSVVSGQHGGLWCGKCPKCAFAFAAYAAFLPLETLEEIFGRNLYDDESLLPLFRELLGLQGCKPFECVGTPHETIAAFYLCWERKEVNETPAMRMFEKEILPNEHNHKEAMNHVFTPDLDAKLPEELPPLNALI